MTLLLFVLGLALVIAGAEKLVESVVKLSVAFGLSAFLVAVVFVGFDPENLAVGAAAAYDGAAGIALGSIVGAALVAILFAFGVTALVVPLAFARVPLATALLPPAAAALLWVLAADGLLSRLDGALLLAAFAAALVALGVLTRRGLDVEPAGEVAKGLAKGAPSGRRRWRTVLGLALALGALFVGSELLVRAAISLVERFGLSETAVGMTALAFLVSIEELARELPAALRGRPDITLGNVVGSALAFFLFNAGVVALVRPVEVPAEVLSYHLPAAFAAAVVVGWLAARRAVPRWAGALLVLLYLAFVAGAWR